jgi:hypothetical protein
MSALELIAAALGLGFLSGLRLYATVLALGLGIRYEIWKLSPEMSQLAVLADWRVLLAAAIGCVIEFLADKIPWVDSLWDSIHTVIRPIGALVIASQAFGELDPVARTLLMLLGGTAALASHSSKAATRLAVNHSPEPFSNVALSVLGDLFVPAGLWMLFHHPVITLTAVMLFLAVFAWLSVRILRFLRRGFRGLRERRLASGSWLPASATKV